MTERSCSQRIAPETFTILGDGIHAPRLREEGDLGSELRWNVAAYFYLEAAKILSTPSARRGDRPLTEDDMQNFHHGEEGARNGRAF